VACGHARWKIENETFNVLKTRAKRLSAADFRMALLEGPPDNVQP
jgi:hypothetical protein